MLEVISISRFSTFQDLGRSGFYSKGISRSGAADYYALFEGGKDLAHAEKENRVNEGEGYAIEAPNVDVVR